MEGLLASLAFVSMVVVVLAYGFYYLWSTTFMIFMGFQSLTKNVHSGKFNFFKIHSVLLNEHGGILAQVSADLSSDLTPAVISDEWNKTSPGDLSEEKTDSLFIQSVSNAIDVANSIVRVLDGNLQMMDVSGDKAQKKSLHLF